MCNDGPFMPQIGDIWSFVSAVMFGVHMLRTEHHSKTLAHEDSLPVMALQVHFEQTEHKQGLVK